LLAAQLGSFVALGDSFTEGMGDPGADGSCLRGWAARIAERLAADRPALRYANLAVACMRRRGWFRQGRLIRVGQSG